MCRRFISVDWRQVEWRRKFLIQPCVRSFMKCSSITVNILTFFAKKIRSCWNTRPTPRRYFLVRSFFSSSAMHGRSSIRSSLEKWPSLASVRRIIDRISNCGTKALSWCMNNVKKSVQPGAWWFITKSSFCSRRKPSETYWSFSMSRGSRVFCITKNWSARKSLSPSEFDPIGVSRIRIELLLLERNIPQIKWWNQSILRHWPNGWDIFPWMSWEN